MTDCVAELSEDERERLWDAIRENGIQTGIQLMQEKGLCDECCLFYSVVNVVTFNSAHGVPLSLLLAKFADAVLFAYPLQGNENDGNVQAEQSRH